MTHNPKTLIPLDYHSRLVDELMRSEPELWAFFSDSARIESDSNALRADLLRSTYRITGDAHPNLLALVETAAKATGISVPVHLYQAPSAEPNASLVFVPNEAIVVCYGPIVDLLEEPQLLAVLGHELSHHRLWSLDSSRFLVAERLLTAMLDNQATPLLAESQRRMSLCVELFADRGAFAACGDLAQTVQALVSVTTSLRSVNAEAFLAQADEVLASDSRSSEGITHPELFLRALALRDFADAKTELSEQVHKALFGLVDVDRLDLMTRSQVERLTRFVIDSFLTIAEFRTDECVAHARAFFPQYRLPTESPKLPDPSVLRDLAESTQSMLSYVLLDFVTIDPDLEQVPLEHAGRIAQQLGIAHVWEALSKKELGG